jgi:hypothetical protein
MPTGRMRTAVHRALLNNNTNVYTRIRDLGSFVNDLKLSGKFDLTSKIRANVYAGWFYMSQNIAMDWHTNRTFSEAQGSNPAMLDLYDASGNLLTANGIAGYGNNCSCCARNYDYTFTDNAPYVSLNLDGGDWQVDGSLRQDFNHGQGTGSISTGRAYTTNVYQYNAAKAAYVTTAIPYYLPDAAAEVINYSKDMTSWSFGGLYKPMQNMSLCSRLAWFALQRGSHDVQWLFQP